MKVADEDLERALRNWGRWKACGGVSLHSSFPTGELVGDREPWSTPPPPIIDSEADEMDKIIEKLPERYRYVIRERYVMETAMSVIARRRSVCEKTAYNWLEHAWSLIRADRAARTEAAHAKRALARADHEASRAFRHAAC